MIFQETVAEPKKIEEESPCMFCSKSDHIKVGVSTAVIGFFFFLSLGYCVWARNQRDKKALTEAVVAVEGRVETANAI